MTGEVALQSVAEAKIKRVRAVQLVAEGKSYDEVAREVGFSHRGSAHRAVTRALAEREADSVDLLRQVENDRLDVMLSALWPRIVNGDLEAIETALKITDRRMRLMGLTPSSRQGDGKKDYISLVVGPQEGNPERATFDDVHRWSRAIQLRSSGSGHEATN